MVNLFKITCFSILAFNNSYNSPARSVRTTLSWRQKSLLSYQFNKNQFPNKDEKQELIEQTGLTMAFITKWFENKRSRNRKRNSLRHNFEQYGV